MFEKWIRIASIQALDVFSRYYKRNVWMVAAQVFSTSLSLLRLVQPKRVPMLSVRALTYVVEPMSKMGKRYVFYIFRAGMGTMCPKKIEKEKNKKELK